VTAKDKDNRMGVVVLCMGSVGCIGLYARFIAWPH
jgi:alpha-beta hydrolase superfamily lysophospholipase